MVTYQSGNIKDAGAKTGGEAVYYNIDYRSYKSGTKVVTWSADEMKKAGATIDKVQQILATRDRGLEKLKPDSRKLSGSNHCRKCCFRYHFWQTGHPDDKGKGCSQY